ncbi:MAG: NADH-quinone oxidoreductase subunit M [Ignavibacteriaceae bacterium]|nr:NADH-quinone oxidoreductase subunit M [Ignavibacteriaceae bacterium]
METSTILNYLLFVPLAGALLLMVFPSANKNAIRYFGLFTSLVTFIISLLVYYSFDSGVYGFDKFQFEFKYSWISDLSISYYVGVDGLSLILVLLTTFLTPLTLLSTWNSIQIKVKEFTFFMLVLEMGMIGVFISLDLFLFYVFWEAMLIPMYFIIGIWGGERRIYASVKFFIYTMFGSLLMLVAIIWLAVYASSSTGYFTTNLLELYKVSPALGLDIQTYLFFAFALSFAIKVPLFPLHTWLPDAHVEAPTAGSVILAGVLLKMGTYGLVRFCLPLFPQASVEYAGWISLLAVIGVIYGALVAMVQKDMKKLVAYSSVSHLGFVVLGIFAFTPEGMQGAIIQMINHGLSTGALFLLVGFIYERTHTRQIADYGGIAAVVPVYSAVMLIVALSSIGLPGLNGFIGEFLILIGAFKSPVLSNWMYAIVAASGVIFAAVYLLWMYQRIFFGPVKKLELRGLTDMNGKELFIMVTLIIFIVWIGVYPTTFLQMTDKYSSALVNSILSVNGIIIR